MGFAAVATSSPKPSTASDASVARGSSQTPASSNACAAKVSASCALTTVGATEPSATRIERPTSSTCRHRFATAITIAFRVPIFEKEPGPRGTFHRAPRISSPGSRAVCFTPVRNSRHGTERVEPPALRQDDLGVPRREHRERVAGG